MTNFNYLYSSKQALGTNWSQVFGYLILPYTLSIVRPFSNLLSSSELQPKTPKLTLGLWLCISSGGMRIHAVNNFFDWLSKWKCTNIYCDFYHNTGWYVSWLHPHFEFWYQRHWFSKSQLPMVTLTYLPLMSIIMLAKLVTEKIQIFFKVFSQNI